MSVNHPASGMPLVPILAPLAPIALICLLANQFSDPVKSNLVRNTLATPSQLPFRLLCR
jgi:hypothetical protein